MAKQTGAASKRKKSSDTTKTINGKRFVKESCSKTKSAAMKKADSIRAAGGTARVFKFGAAHCVYKGPKSKVKKSSAGKTTTRRKVATRTTTKRRKAGC